MKKLLAIAVAFLSVSAQATELDDLLSASQSIVDTFGQGIKVVSGQANYAEIGGISPSMASSYYITTSQMTAYNEALSNMANFSTGMQAQEYFDQQSQQALQQMSQAISVYTDAATAVVQVAEVNNMVAKAVEEGDNASAIEIKNYVEDNELTLAQPEIDAYNNALQEVETAAQTAASFMAVALSADKISEANTMAEEQLVSYSDAVGVQFNAASGIVEVAFTDSAAKVQLDVLAYYRSSTDILTEGELSTFYNTSPVSQCYFSSDYEMCNVLR